MRLIDQIDILTIAEKRLDLKKRGNEYTCCCPFHEEKTPSFSIVPDKQMFYCFGCGSGGDAIKLIMKLDDLSFKEALQEIADITGIELDHKPSKSKINKKELQYYLNTIATRLQDNEHIFNPNMLCNDNKLNKYAGLITDEGITINGLTAPVFNTRNKIIGFYSDYGIARSINFTNDAYIGTLTNTITEEFHDIFQGMTKLVTLNKNIMELLARKYNAITFVSKNNLETLKQVLLSWPEKNVPFIDFHDGRLQMVEDILNEISNGDIKNILATMPDSSLKLVIEDNYG